MQSKAASRTLDELSAAKQDSAGRNLVASVGASKYEMQACVAFTPASRAWLNGSFIAFKKKAGKARALVPAFSLAASLQRGKQVRVAATQQTRVSNRN